MVLHASLMLSKDSIFKVTTGCIDDDDDPTHNTIGWGA
jgi:hypothetical protein